MPSNQFTQVVDELYDSFNRVPHPPGSDQRRHPEHTRHLLDALGCPDRSYPVVMVTGSKGKGSTAYYLSELLRAHGHRVGFFSSPGFLSDLDRIRVDGRVISEDDFARTWATIRPLWKRLLDDMPNDQYIGPVGLFAIIASEYFKNQGVTFAVIETGRGARFDDVAQLYHTHAVLTNILPEHLRELGPTLDDVAWHKVGIVHPETQTLFVGTSSPELDRAIAKDRPQWPPDVTVIDLTHTITIGDRNADASGTHFHLTLPSGTHLPSLHLPTVGPTVDNFAVALAISERLLPRGLSHDLTTTLAASLVWPGRGQVLSAAPYLLLDASIHRRSAEALLLAAGGRFDRVVLSLPNSKDRDGIQQVLEPVSDSIIYTTCTNPYLRYDYSDVTVRPGDLVVDSVHQALSESLAHAVPTTRILWMGTVSFVADGYRHLGRTLESVAPLDLGEALTQAHD